MSNGGHLPWVQSCCTSAAGSLALWSRIEQRMLGALSPELAAGRLWCTAASTVLPRWLPAGLLLIHRVPLRVLLPAELSAPPQPFPTQSAWEELDSQAAPLPGHCSSSRQITTLGVRVLPC